MKLLLCRSCQDIFRLVEEERTCRCGSTKGAYTGNVQARYSGPHAVPIGFANESLVRAIKNQPESGMGERFEAFVIPSNCPSFTRRE